MLIGGIMSSEVHYRVMCDFGEGLQPNGPKHATYALAERTARYFRGLAKEVRIVRFETTAKEVTNGD